MKITRKNDNGLCVQDTFKKAIEDKASLTPVWSQKKQTAPLEEEQSFWHKLTTCFQSPLTCNPGVQIDFRMKGMKENPLQTEWIMHPKGTCMSFDNPEKWPDSNDETKPNGFIEFEMTRESKKASIIDEDKQFMLLQVLDNEIERASSDRVIAEAIVMFTGFDSNPDQENWCKINVYESLGGKPAGQVIMRARFIENPGNDAMIDERKGDEEENKHAESDKINDNKNEKQEEDDYVGNKLQIYVENLIKLQDVNADLVKDDSTIQRDVILLIVWLIYMILSIIFYIYGEDFIFIDALYLRIVTAFTVGYGDLYPVSNAGKILNCLFIIIDTVTIGFITSKVMNYILRFREIVCLFIFNSVYICSVCN